MQRRKALRAAALVLAAGVTATSFVGCGGQKQTNAPASTQVKQDGAAGKNTLVSEKPIEVRIFLEDRADQPWTNEMEAIKELSKRTNVNFKFELAPQGNAEDKFNIIIASGDLPDILNFYYKQISKYAEKGAYEPLNDLIDKNAPNIKKALAEDPSYTKELTFADGKMYLLPNIGAIKVSEVFYMRQDWLDKVGMKAPSTTDDWYNVLKSFKEKDANGNGKQDEIPFSNRSKRAGLAPFIYSWGIQDEEFYIEDGKIKFGATEPKMKEALTWLNKLYKEGLIDRDYLTNDAKLWEARFANEVSGATHDWISRLTKFNVDVKKINPKADFVAVQPPKGPAGGTPFTTKQQTKLRLDNGCAAIASTSKYKKEIIKMFDYMFSEEGSMLMNFGIEGKHYKMENGNPVYTDLIMKSADGKAPATVLGAAGINRDIPMKKDLRYENQLSSPESQLAIKMYEPLIKAPYPKLKFNDSERDINTKFTEIRTYKDEMLDKFITGYESLDKFDDFVKKIKTMGIDDVIKVHEQALKRYNETK